MDGAGEGAWSAGGLEPGTYAVFFSAGPEIPPFRLLSVSLSPGEHREVPVRVLSCSLALSVLEDGGGLPVAESRAFLRGGHDDLSLADFPAGRAPGRFEAPDLPFNQGIVVVLAEGYEMGVRPFEAAAGSRLEMEIRLRRGPGIWIRVDSGGRPSPESLLVSVKSRRFTLQNFPVRLRGEEKYNIPIAPGNYGLRIDAKGFQTCSLDLEAVEFQSGEPLRASLVPEHP